MGNKKSTLGKQKKNDKDCRLLLTYKYRELRFIPRTPTTEFNLRPLNPPKSPNFKPTRRISLGKSGKG